MKTVFQTPKIKRPINWVSHNIRQRKILSTNSLHMLKRVQIQIIHNSIIHISTKKFTLYTHTHTHTQAQSAVDENCSLASDSSFWNVQCKTMFTYLDDTHPNLITLDLCYHVKCILLHDVYNDCQRIEDFGTQRKVLMSKNAKLTYM